MLEDIDSDLKDKLKVQFFSQGSSLSKLVPYSDQQFNSKWACAQFDLPKNNSNFTTPLLEQNVPIRIMFENGVTKPVVL